MNKSRNRGTRNGMIRMGGILYSGKYCQAFWEMSQIILGNVPKYSGECRQTFRGMSPNFPGISSNILGNVLNIQRNVLEYSGDCRQTFRRMSVNIPGNVAKHPGVCP